MNGATRINQELFDEVVGFKRLNSKAKETLALLSKKLVALPRGIVTEKVHTCHIEMAVTAGKIEDALNDIESKGCTCETVCKVRVLFWEFEMEQSSFYKELFFNSLSIVKGGRTQGDRRTEKIELAQVRQESERVGKLNEALRQKAEHLQEIEELKREIERLNTELGSVKAETTPPPPKTANGTTSAMDKRLEEWKGQAVVMAKMAYQCGLEDRREVIRADFETMAAKYGVLSKAGIDLLRSAIPEVAKTTPGASRQR